MAVVHLQAADSQQPQRSAGSEDMGAHQCRAPIGVTRFQRAHDLQMMRGAADQILILVGSRMSSSSAALRSARPAH